MATSLKRKARKNRTVARQRRESITRMNSLPPIKNIDVEKIKEEFEKNKKPGKGSAGKKEEKPAPKTEAKTEVKQEAPAKPEAKQKAPAKEEKPKKAAGNKPAADEPKAVKKSEEETPKGAVSEEEKVEKKPAKTASKKEDEEK